MIGNVNHAECMCIHQFVAIVTVSFVAAMCGPVLYTEWSCFFMPNLDPIFQTLSYPSNSLVSFREKPDNYRVEKLFCSPKINNY